MVGTTESSCLVDDFVEESPGRSFDDETISARAKGEQSLRDVVPDRELSMYTGERRLQRRDETRTRVNERVRRARVQSWPPVPLARVSTPLVYSRR